MMMRILKHTGLILTVSALSWGQARPPEPDRSAAYYNYTLARLYANLAGEARGGEYVNQAIAAYKAAIAADPRAAQITDELADFYIQLNRVQQARNEAEEAIRRNPNDLAAHRLLSRLYVRLISDPQTQRIDPNMLRRAIESYQRVTELDPEDIASLVFLGRLQRAAGNIDAAGRSFDRALALNPDNEDALVGRASVYADKGDSEAAAELFARAAEKNPSPASWQRLAAAYEQMKEYKLAAETIRKALALNPPNAADLRKALAQDLLNAGQYEQAVEAWEAVAAEDNEDAEAWLRVSQLHMQLGNLAKAREASEKALAIDAQNVEVAFNQVSILQAEGKPREAIQALRKLLDATQRRTLTAQQRASRIALLERLAVMHRMLDQPDEAVAAYREIQQLDPTTEARVAAEVIDSLRGGKKFAEAEREAEAAIRKFPNDRAVRIARATLEADLGRAEAAAADIRKLLGGEDDRAIYMVLAELYQKGRNFTEAAKALDEAEKLSTDQDAKVSVWFMRGALYEKMKDLPRAEAEFRKVLAVYPDHAAALNYLGYMLTDRNVRVTEALSLIERALARDPHNGAYLDSLGWAYYRLGRYAEAEEKIRRAVELAPGDPTMHDHFADVLMQQKKVSEAVANWEEALRQWQASAPADRDAQEIENVRNKLNNALRQLGR
jgi:tetratricopeptide (TPR) repeat protein